MSRTGGDLKIDNTSNSQIDVSPELDLRSKPKTLIRVSV